MRGEKYAVDYGKTDAGMVWAVSEVRGEAVRAEAKNGWDVLEEIAEKIGERL